MMRHLVSDTQQLHHTGDTGEGHPGEGDHEDAAQVVQAELLEAVWLGSLTSAPFTVVIWQRPPPRFCFHHFTLRR